MLDQDPQKTESRILKFWKDNKIFQKSLEQRKNAKPFVFFEGPPTANGLPHIGHLVNILFKDIYGRYKTMRGFFVLRRAGWDTHGLPVEIEVEKQLGFKSKKDIEQYGISKFNKRCRESVWKYKAEWERLTERIGYWIDMGHPYITYDPKYIETLWWIIKKISDKKLLYLGHKVVPYCPRCGVTLSSHEVAQGYKDITENSVFVKLKVKKQGSQFDKVYLLAWTTTPWTLPGNVALAVGEKIIYVEAENPSAYGGDSFIIAKNLIKILGEGTKIIKEFSGKELVGLTYEPLFEIPTLKTKNSYKVYPADFVTTEEGTGIVHAAVMYGVDDYELGKKVGLPAYHTVDEQGRFTADVPEFAGQYVKNAESAIIEYLRKKNLLFKAEPNLHSYPFCWRCDTQLLYYAKNSWFIRMSSLQKNLIKNNQEINWIPEHIKNGRFGEFIKEAKDWALSRERYWGTPLPIWKCSKCQDISVIGSLEELEKNRFHKKNTYYLLRHGLSAKSRNGKEEDSIIATRLEHDKYDLTQDGIDQIKEVSRKLKKDGGVHLIISSPFLRTKHSAQIVSEYLAMKFKIDKRLKEIDFGLMYEGKPFSTYPAGSFLDFKTKRGDGESWQDVKTRVASLIKELEQKHEGKKILLVSHGDPIWMIQGLAENRSEEDMLKNHGNHYPKEGKFRKVEFKNVPLNEDGNIDLHRPFIDEIFLKCPKCPAPRDSAQRDKSKMTRVPELVDVWFDSGAMPLAQWHYPFENKELIDGSPPSLKLRRAKQYPADYISEAIDQTRGWFYTLLAEATALGRKAPYKNVITHGHILDAGGKKMSKSKGNAIRPDEVIDKVGADATRWFFFANTTPGNPTPLSMKDFETKYFGFISTLRNTLRFYELYSDSVKPTGSPQPKTILDQWVWSRLQNLIAEVTENLDTYNPTTASRKIEDFVINDLSNWWVRRSRKRFQRPYNHDESLYVTSFLRYILLEMVKILAPFTPFIAEEIHLALHKGVRAGTLSVHLHDWPSVNEKLKNQNEKLLKEMQEIRNFATLGLAARKVKQIKVRQPLAAIILKRKEKFADELEELIKDELNVKEIRYDEKLPSADGEAALDENLTEDLIHEGYAREIMRQIQDMRKDAKYKIDEKVHAAWESGATDVIVTINKFGEEIKRDTLLTDLSKGHTDKPGFDVEKEFELASGIKIWLGIKK